MTEVISTFCDYCNANQDRRSDGRGYADMLETTLVEEFGWLQTDKGIMCPDCQDET